MPTINQLNANRRFERMFGLSPIDSYGDEHLSQDELFARKQKDRQLQEDMKNNADKGEILGHFQWDEELQDMKFTPVGKSEIKLPKS